MEWINAPKPMDWVEGYDNGGCHKERERILIYFSMIKKRCGLDRDYSVYVLGGTRFSFFFFFFLYTRFNWGQKLLFILCGYCSYCFVVFTHFSATFSLKMDPTALFTHLKIILLQCFQFSTKISCIQMDPKHFFQLLM